MGRKTHHDEFSHVPIFSFSPPATGCIRSNRSRHLPRFTHPLLRCQLRAQRNSCQSHPVQACLENSSREVHRRAATQSSPNEDRRIRRIASGDKGVPKHLCSQKEASYQEAIDGRENTERARTCRRSARPHDHIESIESIDRCRHLHGAGSPSEQRDEDATVGWFADRCYDVDIIGRPARA